MVMVGEVEAPSDENSGMRLYPRVVTTLHWVWGLQLGLNLASYVSYAAMMTLTIDFSLF